MRKRKWMGETDIQSEPKKKSCNEGKGVVWEFCEGEGGRDREIETETQRGGVVRERGRERERL